MFVEFHSVDFKSFSADFPAGPTLRPTSHLRLWESKVLYYTLSYNFKNPRFTGTSRVAADAGDRRHPQNARKTWGCDRVRSVLRYRIVKAPSRAGGPFPCLAMPSLAPTRLQLGPALQIGDIFTGLLPSRRR